MNLLPRLFLSVLLITTLTASPKGEAVSPLTKYCAVGIVMGVTGFIAGTVVTTYRMAENVTLIADRAKDYAEFRLLQNAVDREFVPGVLTLPTIQGIQLRDQELFLDGIDPLAGSKHTRAAAVFDRYLFRVTMAGEAQAFDAKTQQWKPIVETGKGPCFVDMVSLPKTMVLLDDQGYVHCLHIHNPQFDFEGAIVRRADDLSPLPLAPIGELLGNERYTTLRVAPHPMVPDELVIQAIGENEALMFLNNGNVFGGRPIKLERAPRKAAPAPQPEPFAPEA